MTSSDRVWVHVDPIGHVVVSCALPDGRIIRVVGAAAYRGCAVAAELDKWLRWLRRTGAIP